MDVPVTLTPAPPLAQFAKNARFVKSDFEDLIFNHGYDVIIEKVIRCPCKSKGGDNMSSCKNCAGSGWLWINPNKTKAILKSMNANTKFKEWSEENVGNANITLRDVDRISFMDKITVLNGESMHTQNVYPVDLGNVIFSFTDYPVKEMEEVYMFLSGEVKLKKLLPTTDYTISDDKIILNNKFKNTKNFTLSLRYIHAPQFLVVDIIRDVMSSQAIPSPGESVKNVQMPVSAVGRRLHYVLNRQNFVGDYLFDNSYIADSCKDEKTECP